jgi:hypothetical protein
MATVYLAHDLRHHREVAVKVLRPELFVEQFDHLGFRGGNLSARVGIVARRFL